MRHQQRMKVMKDTTRKIRSEGRMDANDSWWVRELLAADFEKAWLHPGWEGGWRWSIKSLSFV